MLGGDPPPGTKLPGLSRRFTAAKTSVNTYGFRPAEFTCNTWCIGLYDKTRTSDPIRLTGRGPDPNRSTYGIKE